MTQPRWSVIVPAFNEAERLPRYLDEIVSYFEGRGEPYEVLIVDDGSTDDTPRVVSTVARGGRFIFPSRLAHYNACDGDHLNRRE